MHTVVGQVSGLPAFRFATDTLPYEQIRFHRGFVRNIQGTSQLEFHSSHLYFIQEDILTLA